jgi:uracil-DNA glycosylase family 4
MIKNVIKFIPKNNPKIAIVGEAPGTDEVLNKLPFVGFQGKYLNRLLQKARIKREEVFLTNIVHEKPPKNNYKSLPIETRQEGIKELKKDLEQFKKKGLNIVITLGAEAMFVLTGLSKITAHRGYVVESSLVPGLKILPTLHPETLTRGQGKFEFVVIADLKKAVRESSMPQLTFPKRNILVIRDAQEAIARLRSISDIIDPVTVDIETAGGKMTAYGWATSRSEGFSIVSKLITNVEVLRAISQFAYSSTPKIFHNALFDAFHNAFYYKIINKNIFGDTMLAQHSVYPTLLKSLGFCASLYTDEPFWKESVWETNNLDNDALYIYNGKDCCLTYEIWEKLMLEISAWKTEKPYKLMIDNIPPVLFSMIKGIRINRQAVKEYGKEILTGIKKLDMIVEKVLPNVNLNSPKQLQELLYDNWELPIQYKKKKITTESKKLQHLASLPTPYSDLIQLILLAKKTRKRKDFQSIKIDKDNRIRTALKICGTYTGRWSSSKSITGSGKNLQNIPKEARVIFVPDDEKIFIQMDLSQSEARFVAALCNDKEWLEDFNKRDLHSVVASMLFDLPIEKIKKSTHRYIAKRVAHATHYLLGWRLLSEILGCSAKEAKQYKATYLRMRPSLARWHKKIKTEVAKTRIIRTDFEWTMQFFGIFFNQHLTEATAAEPQSLSANYLSRAINKCYEEIPEFEFLLQVHDSILLQVPDNYNVIKRVMQKMKKITEQKVTVNNLSLIIPADFEIGYNWRDLVEVNPHDFSKEYKHLKETKR